MAGSDSKGAVARARQLLKEKRYADALQVCTDELARGAEDLQLRLIAAHSLLAQGRHEGAKKEAQLVIRLEPRQAEAYRILADISCTRGELATACEHLERVLELDPNDDKSRSLLETLSRPSSLPLPDGDAAPDAGAPLPPAVQSKLKATSVDRFIEDSVPSIELSHDDLIEEVEVEEVEEDDAIEEEPTRALPEKAAPAKAVPPAIAKILDEESTRAVSPSKPQVFDEEPTKADPEAIAEIMAQEAQHVDPFSGEMFQVTDSMIEELPKKPEPKPEPKPIQVEPQKEEAPPPGLRTEHDISVPEQAPPTAPKPPPPEAAEEEGWKPKLDVGAGKGVKYQGTLRLPALEDLPDDDDAPTMPLLRPTAPPPPQLKLDPMGSKPVSHEKVASRLEDAILSDLPPAAATADEGSFEDFEVEPASVPLQRPEPQPIPKQTLDPVKAREAQRRKMTEEEVLEAPDPLALMTGAADTMAEEHPAGRMDPSLPAIGDVPQEVSGNLMGLLTGDEVDRPGSGRVRAVGRSHASDTFPAVEFHDPEESAGLGDVSLEQQLMAAGISEPREERRSYRWLLVMLIGLVLGGGGLFGYLWYRSYKYIQGEWATVRTGVHKSTPEGFRSAKKAAERIIKHRKQDPKASAAIAMCDAAMSVEFGEDRLKTARQRLEEAKGTDTEWRTAASAYLALIDAPAQAVGYLQKALEVYPKSALLNYLRGRALAGSGDPEGAAQSYDKALSLVPNYVAAQIALAVLKGREEAGYGEALSALDQILDKNPNNFQARIERARLRAHHNKDLDGAVEDAGKITADPKKAGKGQVGWAHLVLAQVARLRQDYATMSTELDEATKSPSVTDSSFFYEVSGELISLYRMPDAFLQMQRALELEAKKPENLHRMARVLLELDDPKQAGIYIKSAPARMLQTKLLMGRQAYAMRRYNKAAGLLKRVLAEDKNNVEAAIYLALAEARQKKTTAAVRSLQKLAAQHKGNHKIYLALAQVHLWSNELDQMHGTLKSAWKITKLDPRAQTLSGRMHVRKHEYQLAAKRFARALQTRPEYRPARIGLARLLLRTGQVAEARKQLGYIAQVDRKKPDLFAITAQIELAEGKLESARTSIAQAEAAGAPKSMLTRLTGELALAQDQPKVALEMLRKSVKLGHRRSADLLALQAKAELGCGLIDDAYDTLHVALKYDDGHPEILMELGKIATKDREYNIAIRRLNQALEKVKERQRPQSMQAAVHAALATTYLNKGDTGRAITNSQDAIDLDPNAAEPQYVMGLTYMRLERPQRAIPFLAKAVQLDPSRLEAYEQLGKAYAKAGDKANALKWYQAYLGRNPPAAGAGRVTREMQRLQGQ